MLGQLMSAAKSFTPAAYTRAIRTPGESTIEEQHTADLLFPLASGYWQDHNIPDSPTHPWGRASGFDDRGGLELDENRDLRLLVAQDAVAGQDKPCVLFDSMPGRIVTGAASESAPAPAHWQLSPRGGPNNVSPLAGQKREAAPATTSRAVRHRSATFSEAPSPLPRDVEGESEISSLLECMFGASSSAKSASSTKMHLIRSQAPTSQMNAPINAEKQSQTTRRQAMSRSQTATNFGSKFSESMPSGSPRNAVLITHMFSVDLPEVVEMDKTPATSPDNVQVGAHQDGPGSAVNETQGSKKPKLREKKTPAFAVALILNISREPETRPNSHHSRTASLSPRLASSPGSPAFGSHSSWSFLDYLASMSELKPINDRMASRLDTVLAQWDIVLRSLALIELEATKKILQLLRQAEEASRIPQAKVPKEKTMQRTNQRVIHLSAWALANTQKLRDLARSTILRVASAIRTLRVRPGQGLLPGGHWLEEAQIVTRACRASSQNNFLYSLLTAFLGDHLEWTLLLKMLDVQNEADSDNGRCYKPPLASRTVIVCKQRSLARRVVFLLASFLPQPGKGQEETPPQSLPHDHDFHSLHKHRRESLRRTIRIRPDDTQTPADFNREQENFSSEPHDVPRDQAGSQVRPNLTRQGSETPSLQIAGSLPIPTKNVGNRKSTATTASEEDADIATPIPYFVSHSQQRDSYFPPISPSVTNHTASAGLSRHLRQNSGGGGRSTASTTWGSLLGGFWSGRGESGNPGRNTSPTIPRDQTFRTNTQRRISYTDTRNGWPTEEAERLDKMGPSQGPSSPASQWSSRGVSTPLHMTVDKIDGVVDVDLTIPGFLSTSYDAENDSPSGLGRSSPSFRTTNSIRSFTSHAQTAVNGQERDPIRVAGYLRRYHQDFVLQAVTPYDSLIEEISQSMRLEPTPSHDTSDTGNNTATEEKDQWIEVCSTLIADATSFTVQRLTLKRKLPRRPKSQDASDEQFTSPQRRQHSFSPFSSDPFEEIITTETLISFDPTLAEAIDRALNNPSTPSTYPSRAPSPSSRTHSRTVSTSSNAKPTSSTVGAKSLTPPTAANPLANDAVPTSRRDPRRVVVGALAEVVKSVNADLHRHENGRDIGPSADGGSIKSGGGGGDVAKPGTAQHAKEENELREGVKRWLVAGCGGDVREVW